MRTLKALIATTLLAALSAVFALDGAEDQTVLQGLQGSPEQFSTFLSMLETAGLTDTLLDAAPVTVLAPTNAAFDEMDDETLNDIQSDPADLDRVLSGLILPGAYTMLDLKESAAEGLTPFSGEPYEIDVTAGGLKVNGVGFQATDVDNVFSNGVVHVTDTVVLPIDLRELEQQRSATNAEGPPATDATPPGDEAVPAVPPVATVPVTEPDATPGGATPEGLAPAFVRVVQLAPNTSVNTRLDPEDEELSAVDFGGIDYGQASGYQQVEAGKYVINTSLPDTEALFDTPEYTFRAGQYYTVALTGLRIPTDTDTSTDEGGFAGWLRNLFSTEDANRDALTRKVTVYDDQVRADATDSRVRVIDAAPGSPAFDIVTIDAEGERNVLAGNMTYGDDSGNKKVGDDVTGLEVTAADSAAVAIELSDAVPLPSDATMFLMGTTFEGAPYRVLILPNGPSASMGATYGN